MTSCKQQLYCVIFSEQVHQFPSMKLSSWYLLSRNSTSISSFLGSSFKPLLTNHASSEPWIVYLIVSVYKLIFMNTPLFMNQVCVQWAFYFFGGAKWWRKPLAPKECEEKNLRKFRPAVRTRVFTELQTRLQNKQKLTMVSLPTKKSELWLRHRSWSLNDMHLTA